MILKKTHKVLLMLLGVIVLAVVGFKAMQPKEPEYKGRRLSEWIADLYGPSHLKRSSEAVVKEAKDVFLPFIEYQLRNTEFPRSKSQLEVWIFNAQVATGIGFRQSSTVQWDGCFNALKLYGNDALPVLERLLTNNSTSLDAANLLVKLNAIEVLEKYARPEQPLFTRILSANSLGEVTQRKADAVKVLIPMTTESNSELVQTAIYSLGNLTATPEAVIPRLCELLESKDGHVQRSAIHALGKFGTNAVHAKGALEKIIKTTHDYLIEGAAQDSLNKVTAPQIP